MIWLPTARSLTHQILMDGVLASCRDFPPWVNGSKVPAFHYNTLPPMSCLLARYKLAFCQVPNGAGCDMLSCEILGILPMSRAEIDALKARLAALEAGGGIRRNSH